MRKIYSSILLGILFVIGAGTAFAQRYNPRFSIGPELWLPVGDEGNAYSSAIGVAGRGEFPTNNVLAVTFTAGYERYQLRTELSDISLSAVPIQAGAKIYFGEQQNNFYLHVESGIHILIYRYPYDYAGTVYTKTARETEFSLAPGLGFMMQNVDFSLRYQSIIESGYDTHYLGMHVAFVFGKSSN